MEPDIRQISIRYNPTKIWLYICEKWHKCSWCVAVAALSSRSHRSRRRRRSPFSPWSRWPSLLIGCARFAISHDETCRKLAMRWLLRCKSHMNNANEPTACTNCESEISAYFPEYCSSVNMRLFQTHSVWSKLRRRFFGGFFSSEFPPSLFEGKHNIPFKAIFWGLLPGLKIENIFPSLRDTSAVVYNTDFFKFTRFSDQ